MASLTSAPLTSAPPTASCEPPPLGRRTWAIALAVALLTCLWRVVFANQRGLWLDEFLTLSTTEITIPEMIKERLLAGHSPLYFFFARLGPMLGSSECALRLTSALAAGGAVLLLTGLMGELRLARYLPWAWLLALCHPYWISIGMEYRYTMPLIAVALAAAWAAARHAARPTLGRGAVLALAIALFLWTHGSAPFFTLGLLAFLVWDGLATEAPRGVFAKIRVVLRRGWPVLAGVAAGVPFYILVRGHHSFTEGEKVHFLSVLNNLIEVNFGDHRLWFRCLHWRNQRGFYALEAILLAGSIVLTRAELLREGRQRVWRLLLSTMLALPLLMYLFCLTVRNFEGPARYLAAFSIPSLLCLAIGAGAAARRARLRWVYLGALLVVLAFQSSAESLQRGDRHRDAIRWIVRNHHDREPIIAMVVRANRMGLEMNGIAVRTRKVPVGGLKNTKTRAATEESIKTFFGDARRGFFIRYHSGDRMLEAVQSLVHQHYFQAERHWKIGNIAYFGAVVRDAQDLPWLTGLKNPEIQWGPSVVEDVK